MDRHDAFISYSRGDKAFAAALEKRLEKFRAPKDLPVRQGYLDVFRDEHDFTGGEYFSSLSRHLEASSTLIVICSPNARSSEFVNDEIRRFADIKGADRIVPVLLAGVPNNEATPEREDEKAFPEALCDVLEMPLAANYLEFDVTRDRIDQGAYTDAWFTLLANVYQVSRSKIEQRERRRRARFVRSVIAVTGSIIAILIAALIVTLFSRAEAVRQAIEARRQIATRLAVQALEKVEVAPETALQLAIDAVETYHRHGDPSVPRALEALHKVQLSFGGGRPVLPWRPDRAEIVFSDDLVWAATSSENDGDIRFTRAGSGDVEVLDPPQVLQPGEQWADYAPILAFTRGRLIAGRPLRDADKRSPKQAALWYWPLTKNGISGPARLIGRYDQRYWRVFEPVASDRGRWLSWYGGRDDLYVKDLSTDRGAPVIFPSSDDLRSLRAFSVDQTRLLAAIEAGLVMISLPSEDQSGADGLPQVEQVLTTSSWELHYALGMAARSPEHRCRGEKDQTGLTQAAILTRKGDVSWWDLTRSPPVERQLPNVFSAFSEQMKVWQLEKKKVRARLEFSVCGHALLASVAERSGEFGIAAHIRLEDDAEWQPVFVEQLKSQLSASMSRIRGDGGGIQGYRLTDQKKLGTAQARWFYDDSLLTIGFDGSFEFHDTERQASQYLTGDAVQVEASYNFNEQGGISVGTRNGRVKIIGDVESNPVFLMSAHDTPVSQLLQDKLARRIVTVGENGAARIWETDNPVMRPDQFRGVSSDWKRFFSGRRPVRSWDIGASDPFRRPVEGVSTKEGKATDESADGAWAVSREIDSDTNIVTLKLHRRGEDVSAESSHQILTIAPPAGEAGEHWRWNYRGWLHVDGEQASYLATGRDHSGDGALLVRLNQSSAAPVTVLDPQDGLKIESVATNLDKLLLTQGEARSDKSEKALEVRGVVHASGKSLFRIEGTRHGDMSEDGRWLVANDKLFDLAQVPVITRATREGPHAWNYRVNFTGGRPPVWLDEEGNLWGVDPAPASTSGPQQLVSGLSLKEIAWSPSSDWLGLGAANGRAWVVQLAVDAPFAKIHDALRKVSGATALPAAWDKRAAVEIERIELLPTAGWVKADTDNNFILLWRGTPETGWSQPLVYHQLDGFHGAGSSTCRHDGEVCVVEGQLMNFDPAQLLPMAKGLLTGAPSLR